MTKERRDRTSNSLNYHENQIACFWNSMWTRRHQKVNVDKNRKTQKSFFKRFWETFSSFHENLHHLEVFWHPRNVKLVQRKHETQPKLEISSWWCDSLSRLGCFSINECQNWQFSIFSSFLQKIWEIDFNSVMSSWTHSPCQHREDRSLNQMDWKNGKMKKFSESDRMKWNEKKLIKSNRYRENLVIHRHTHNYIVHIKNISHKVEKTSSEKHINFKPQQTNKKKEIKFFLPPPSCVSFLYEKKIKYYMKII